jgi:hypothetical protein
MQDGHAYPSNGNDFAGELAFSMRKSVFGQPVISAYFPQGTFSIFPEKNTVIAVLPQKSCRRAFRFQSHNIPRIWTRSCPEILPPSTSYRPQASTRGPCKANAGAKRRACVRRNKRRQTCCLPGRRMGVLTEGDESG